MNGYVFREEVFKFFLLVFVVFEGGRVFFELVFLLIFWLFLEFVCVGDGYLVLFLLGLGVGDCSMVLLRSYLVRCNYLVWGWGFGVNYGFGMVGFKMYLFEKCFIDLYGVVGCMVSVVGWSIGGIYVWELVCCVLKVVC